MSGGGNVGDRVTHKITPLCSKIDPTIAPRLAFVFSDLGNLQKNIFRDGHF